MHVEHLHGGGILQCGSRREARGAALEPGSECDLQSVGQKADVNVRLDAVVSLVIHGADGEVAFELFEGLFDFGELEIKLLLENMLPE